MHAIPCNKPIQSPYSMWFGVTNMMVLNNVASIEKLLKHQSYSRNCSSYKCDPLMILLHYPFLVHNYVTLVTGPFLIIPVLSLLLHLAPLLHSAPVITFVTSTDGSQIISVIRERAQISSVRCDWTFSNSLIIHKENTKEINV